MFLLKCVFFCKRTFVRNLNNHEDGHDRIVGGSAVKIEDNPLQIGLIHGGKTICGGSIIVQEWILTAGHCIA